MSDNLKNRLLLIFGLLLLFLGGWFLLKPSESAGVYPNGELNVLNWTSYLPESVIADFEQEFGVKVNYGTYSSNEELLAKVSSSSAGTYDLIFPSDYMVDLMITRNLLSPLDYSKLKNASNISPLFKNQIFDNKNEFSLPFLLTYSTLVYDSSKISEPINSYNDLLNENYQNNLVLIDDQRIIIGAALLASGADMNSVRDEDLSLALNFFDQLKPNIKAFDSDSPKTFLLTKETDIGLIWNAEATLAKRENENLKIVFPREGFALSMDNYCLLKNAKNVDNAYKFIDFLLRDDVSARIVEEYPYVSPNKLLVEENPLDLKSVLENGSYVKNVGADIKKLDRLWAKFK